MSENSAASVNAPKPLSRQLKWFFGVGDMTFTLMSSVETYYFNFFLTDVAKFAPALAIAIASTASMIDLLLSWVYGAFLSALPARKWGRYRSWLVMVPWIVPFLYAFEFMKIGSDGVAAVIIVAGAVLSHILWNTAYIANLTMVSVVGRTAEGKASMSSTRGAYTALSGILFSYIGLPIITVLGGIIGQTSRYAGGAFVLGWVFALGYFIHFKMTAGYEDDETSASAAAIVAKNKISVGDMFKALFQNSQLLVVILADILWAVSNFVFSGAAVYYWKVMNVNTFQALFITFTAISGFFGSLALQPLVKKFATRSTFIIAQVGTAICFGSFSIFYANPMAVLIMAIIGKFFMNVAFAAFPVMFSDTVIYNSYKTGKNASGWIMGLFNLPIKVGVFLRGIVLTAAITGVGYAATLKPTQFTPQLQQGVAGVFGLLPGALMLLSGIVILIGYKLTREKLAYYQAEIDKK